MCSSLLFLTFHAKITQVEKNSSIFAKKRKQNYAQIKILTTKKVLKNFTQKPNFLQKLVLIPENTRGGIDKLKNFFEKLGIEFVASSLEPRASEDDALSSPLARLNFFAFLIVLFLSAQSKTRCRRGRTQETWRGGGCREGPSWGRQEGERGGQKGPEEREETAEDTLQRPRILRQRWGRETGAHDGVGKAVWATAGKKKYILVFPFSKLDRTILYF